MQGVAIVTGGAWEEGLSAAEAVLHTGLTVSIWDDRTEALARAKAEMAGLGFSPDIRDVDVADPAAVQRTYDAVKAELGPVDVLVNFATLKNTFLLGEHEQRSDRTLGFWETDLSRLLRALDVNVKGTILCSRVVAPDMIERRRGSIVNFTTGEHTQRSIDHIPYGPSKALVDAFTVAAAEQLRPHGVRVNAIASSGSVNRRGQNNPKRQQPWDWMAPMLRYLASEESAGVTGQLIGANEFESFVREAVKA